MTSANTTHRGILDGAVMATFAEMAFIDVVQVPGVDSPVDATKPAIDDPGLSLNGQTVEIEYQSTETGVISLVLSLNCKRAIVENIYGESFDTLKSTERDDCLLELVNVLGGEYINRRFDAVDAPQLSLPRLVFAPFAQSANTQSDELNFDAEGSPFIVLHRYSTTVPA